MKQTISIAFLLGVCLAGSLFAQNPAGLKELKIGDLAPDFKLIGVDDKYLTLSDFKDAKFLAIAFTSNHCPTSNGAFPRLIKMFLEFKTQGFDVVAINPNHPDGLRLDELSYSKYNDGFEDMKGHAKEQQFPFPYLYDGETQTTAMAYGCLATPHIFLFDQERKLRYKGRIDDTGLPDESLVKSPDLRNAITALIDGKPVPKEITGPLGCSTKWRLKKEKVAESDKQWAEFPVSIEPIDAEGVAKLRANPTERYRLINVWSTSCAPCVGEFPGLVNVSRRMGRRPFDFISISTDRAEEIGKAEGFLKKFNAGLPDHRKAAAEQEGRKTNNYIYNGTSIDPLISALDPEWSGVQPHTLFIKPGGEIAFRHSGVISETELVAKILEVMTTYWEPRPPAKKK